MIGEGGEVMRFGCPSFRRHHPRKRVIQYAAAFAFCHRCPGVLDRPVKPGDDISGGAG
jgi:hypothetical protein